MEVKGDGGATSAQGSGSRQAALRRRSSEAYTLCLPRADLGAKAQPAERMACLKKGDP